MKRWEKTEGGEGGEEGGRGFSLDGSRSQAERFRTWDGTIYELQTSCMRDGKRSSLDKRERTKGEDELVTFQALSTGPPSPSSPALLYFSPDVIHSLSFSQLEVPVRDIIIHSCVVSISFFCDGESTVELEQRSSHLPPSLPSFVPFQLLFTFLGICCFAAVASFQSKWKIGVCESRLQNSSGAE